MQLKKMTATHVTVRSLTRRAERVSNNFTHTISSTLQIYLMTYTQKASTVMGARDKIVKECQRAFILMH
jgi:hypothetical protein